MIKPITKDTATYYSEYHNALKPIRIGLYIYLTLLMLVSIVNGVLFDKLELQSLDLSTDTYSGTISELSDITAHMEFESWVGLNYTTDIQVSDLLSTQILNLEGDFLLDVRTGEVIDDAPELKEYLAYSLRTGNTDFSATDDFVYALVAGLSMFLLFAFNFRRNESYAKTYNEIIESGKKRNAVVIRYDTFTLNGKTVLELFLSVDSRGITSRRRKVRVLVDKIPDELCGGAALDLYCMWARDMYIPDMESLHRLV